MKILAYPESNGNGAIAMGPKNACSYADLAIGEIDFQAKFSGPIKELYGK